MHPNRQPQPQPVTRSSAATDSADSSTNTTELQHEPAFLESLTIREGIEREEADKLKSELEEAGGSVELK